MERTDRRLHACACEGADENSWQSRQRHTPAASSAHWYSSVWPGQQRHPIMVKALRRLAQGKDKIASDVSCYRARVQQQHDVDSPPRTTAADLGLLQSSLEGSRPSVGLKTA